MLDINKAYQTLEHSDVFRNWRNQNSDAFLCSMFAISDTNNLEDKEWQIDFYSNNTVTSFISGKEPRLLSSSEEMLNKDINVKELNLKNIKLGLKEAMKIIEKIKGKKYPKEKFTKIIVILQEAIWNISYVTASFKLFNIKIDADSGKVIEEKFMPLFDFKR